MPESTASCPRPGRVVREVYPPDRTGLDRETSGGQPASGWKAGPCRGRDGVGREGTPPGGSGTWVQGTWASQAEEDTKHGGG